jgi:glycosyltransferase involved in cell wall biosynthesis
MRITFLLSSLWHSGGVLLVIEYANRLSQRGHTVHLVVPGDTIDPAVREKLAPAVQLLESNVRLTKPMPFWRLLALIAAMVWVTPSTDVILATHTPTTIPALLARLLGKANHHAWLYMDYDEMFRQRPLERFLLNQMPRCFALLLPISQPLAKQVRPQTRHLVVVTGSGVVRAEAFVHSAKAKQGVGYRLLYVGDNRPRKGLAEFLAAATIVYQQLPTLELVIVSKEPLTVTTAVPYQFHCYPSDEALARLYRQCDLFVSASWGEGLGYPPLEAMASERPVVLTDSVGVRDYARHEVNCLIVPPRNPQAIATAILRLAHDPALAQQLVEQGKETVRHYQWDNVIDRVESALRALKK